MAGQAGWMAGVRRRFEQAGGESLEEGLVIRAGDMRDYEQLSRYHYRAGRPGTVRRVWAAEARSGRVAQWPSGRGGGPRGFGDLAIWQSGELVGVSVVSMPVLSLRLREEALGGRYGRIRDPKARAALINAEVRCISRVVVDPRWRGLGIAVRLVKHALAEAETVYTEAVAAMGAVHPFFERAGMRAYRRPAHEFDLRMKAALGRVGMAVEDIADVAGLAAKMDRLGAGQKEWLTAEMRRWMGRRRLAADERGLTRMGGSGKEFTTENTESTEKEINLAEWLAVARGALLAEPVYYLRRMQEGTKG